MKAPAGLNKYIVKCKNPAGCITILDSLSSHWGLGDLDSIREMRSFTNIFTASLSSAAIKWLCENSDLSKYIDFLEADQAVSIAAGG